jgi:hypothetical protein
MPPSPQDRPLTSYGSQVNQTLTSEQAEEQANQLWRDGSYEEAVTVLRHAGFSKVMRAAHFRELEASDRERGLDNQAQRDARMQDHLDGRSR